MLFSKKKSLEEYILDHLQHGPVVMLDLIEKIKQQRPGTTKQGVYAALRQLKKQEVVVIHKGTASLNVTWLTQIGRYIEVAQHHYFKDEISIGHFANLQNGERIQYSFQNPVLTDAFWNHAVFILIETTPSDTPFIAYDPHVWFYLAHPENELALVEFVATHKRQYLVVSGANTPLDKYPKTLLDGTHAQYHALHKPLFKKNNYYLNIIGDFLIEAWIDAQIAKKIDQFYQEHVKYTDDVRNEFRTIVEQRGKSKLVISRNVKKAERLRKKLIKPFYIPKNK